MLAGKKQGGHARKLGYDKSRTQEDQKDTQKSSLSLVNKKEEKKENDNNKRPKRHFKKLDIHIRGDVM